jgi:hypothetical protein
MQILRLFYVSVATGDWDLEEVLALARQSDTANKQRDISGSLAYEAGLFGQVLEGPEAAVNELLEKIRKDPRHSDLTVLKSGYFDARAFADHGMRVTIGDAYSPMTEAFVIS